MYFDSVLIPDLERLYLPAAMIINYCFWKTATLVTVASLLLAGVQRGSSDPLPCNPFEEICCDPVVEQCGLTQAVRLEKSNTVLEESQTVLQDSQSLLGQLLSEFLVLKGLVEAILAAVEKVPGTITSTGKKCGKDPWHHVVTQPPNVFSFQPVNTGDCPIEIGLTNNPKPNKNPIPKKQIQKGVILPSHNGRYYVRQPQGKKPYTYVFARCKKQPKDGKCEWEIKDGRAY